VELFRDSIRLECILSDGHRAEDLEGGFDERGAGKAASDADQAVFGVHLDQGVEVLARLGATRPPRLWRVATERDRPDLVNPHVIS
jgi:hypothetical protein